MPMGASFDLSDPIVFTAGTVGEPGQRMFFLQARQDATVVTLKCEKQQVGALAEYLSGLLEDLPTVDPDSVPTLLQVVEPIVTEWPIGTLAVAWDENADRMVLVAEELLDEEAAAAGADAGQARFSLKREQVAGFVTRARELVAGGRPPCPLCGAPLDPQGHACPRLN
jgi:uncharacterized repeat protein (TIGR03847 family)